MFLTFMAQTGHIASRIFAGSRSDEIVERSVFSESAEISECILHTFRLYLTGKKAVLQGRPISISNPRKTIWSNWLSISILLRIRRVHIEINRLQYCST